MPRNPFENYDAWKTNVPDPSDDDEFPDVTDDFEPVVYPGEEIYDEDYRYTRRLIY